MQILYVVVASTITALCTGLGVIPFLFSKQISKRSLGLGNALAAGLMMGASIGLLIESLLISMWMTCGGVFVGILMIRVTQSLLKSRSGAENPFAEEVDVTDFRKMILIMTVMTAHSFAEGVGVGVSFGGREHFGELISAAIAVHNIPEGLAIGLVMIPRGVSIFKAAMWSIFSSLPQPIMAVPAFLFVTSFEPLLPFGLGLAAGAMIYMAIFELVPEALENESPIRVTIVSLLAVTAMIVFQFLLS